MNDYIGGYRPVDASAPMTTFSRPITGPNLFIDDTQNEWIDISMPDRATTVNILDIHLNATWIHTNIWDIQYAL